MGTVWSLLCTDLLQSVEYQVRPYEVVPGETAKVVDDSVQHLCEVFRKRPGRGRKWGPLIWHFTTPYFVNALREVLRRFDTIEVDRLRVKPIVKITGEFYLQTVEGDPNYNIHSWLESEGAQVYPAAIAVWLDYWMRWYVQGFEDHIGIDRFARPKMSAVRTLQRLFGWTYNRLRRAMGDLPSELPDQYELRRLAAPYFHSRLSGGEGDMLVGKALWAHLHKKAHMTCELSPYACMPNTMSIGAMAGVLGRHPDLLYAPLEIKGDAEVHALSRCQMILTEAKKRAQKEFEQVLDRTGLTIERARDMLDSRPAMRKATYRVPHLGCRRHRGEPRAASRRAEAPMKVVGVDVGSTTVKAVVVDEGRVIWRDYQRHGTKQSEMVLQFLSRMEAECGLTPGRDRIFLTGSGAGLIAPLTGGRTIQEVVAVAASVERLHPACPVRVRDRRRGHEDHLLHAGGRRPEQAGVHAVRLQRRNRDVHRENGAQAADVVRGAVRNGLRRPHAPQDQLEVRHLRGGRREHARQVRRHGRGDHREPLRGGGVSEPRHAHQGQHADAGGAPARRSQSLLQGPPAGVASSPDGSLGKPPRVDARSMRRWNR